MEISRKIAKTVVAVQSTPAMGNFQGSFWQLEHKIPGRHSMPEFLRHSRHCRVKTYAEDRTAWKLAPLQPHINFHC